MIGLKRRKMARTIEIFHREIEVKTLAEVLLVKLIIIMLLSALYVLGPGITGFITVTKQLNYTDEVSLEFNESGEYTWNVANSGSLKNIKIDGSKSKNGSAKIYIENDGVKYLIFDSSQLVKRSSGLFGITGFAVKDKDKEKDEIETEIDGDLTQEQEDLLNLLISDINTTRNDVEIEIEAEEGEVKKEAKKDITDIQNNYVDDLASMLENSIEKIKIKVKAEFEDEQEDEESEESEEGQEDSEEQNNAPIWNSSFESFIINNITNLDLNNYYYDADGDSLTFSSSDVSNVSITIDNNIVNLVPDDNVDDTKLVTFAAYDGINITYKAVSLIINTIKEVSINGTNETINQTPILNETNQTEVNDTIINETTEKIISINLNYGNNEFYDANNDGIEDLTGVIDLTTANSEFNWEVNENNLCARYEVFNGQESTFLCHGSSGCCAFVDLANSRESWNDSLFLTYGSYGSGNDNIVFSQVLHVDYNLTADVPYSDIVYSSWDNLTAKFEKDIIEFEDVCVDTCLVSRFNSTSYKLIIELNNTKLTIDEIKYSVEEKIFNDEPTLVKNIENVSLIENTNYTLDLSGYFFDADNDTLIYSYFGMENISIRFENNFAYILPATGFTGNRFTYITANDSYGSVDSNVFKISVNESGVPRVQLGKPVRWKQTISINDTNETIKLSIPKTASNITLTSLFNNTIKSIQKEEIKIIDKGKNKTKDEFEKGKELDKVKRKIRILEEAKKEEAEKVVIEEDEVKKGEIDEKLLELEDEETDIENELLQPAGLITGAVVAVAEIGEIIETNETIIEVNETVEEITIEYVTESPYSIEKELRTGKQIRIISETNYTDVLAFTDIKETKKGAIKLYWVKNNNKELFNDVDYLDTNLDGLVDRLEWVVPHLSNQTFEVELTILNVQSFPTVGGNWTVRFNTSGTGNLTIFASNGTAYSELFDDNSSTVNDLVPLSLACNNYEYYDKNNLINDFNFFIVLENNSKVALADTIGESLAVKGVYLEDYSCNATGFWTVQVLTEGVHTQQFNFSGQVDYANNFASEIGTTSNGSKFQFIDDTNTDFNLGNLTNNISLQGTGSDANITLNISHDLVPRMLDFTNPEGRVFESSREASTTNGTNAFDNANSPAWQSFDGGGFVAEYIAYNFTSPKVVNKYTIVEPCCDPGRMPKDWTIEAWDGSAWTSLHNVSGETDWTSGEKRAFAFSNNVAYEMYSLNISATNGAQFRTYIGELDFIHAAPQGNFTSRIFNANRTVNWSYISWQQEVPYQTEIGRAYGDGNDVIQEEGFINTSGLVLLMHFNNETGENDSLVKDYSVEVNLERAGELHNNGTANGSVYNFTNKKFGSASMQFNSSADIRITDTKSLDIANDISLSAWVKLTSNQTGSLHRGIIGSWNFNDNRRSYLLVVRNDDKAGFFLSTTGSNVQSISGTKDIKDNNWHYLVGIRNGSRMSLYVDGQPEGNATLSGSLFDNDIDAEQVRVGSQNGEIDSFFNGSIDEVAIWNRSLSADEILKLYKRGALELNISTRTSDDNVTWNAWTDAYGNSTLSATTGDTTGRYLQYKAVFSTEDTIFAPILNNVSINYSILSNLSIWDSSDDRAILITKLNTFYANFTDTVNTINGTNVFCTFSQNASGSWSAALNMSFNSTTGLYFHNLSFQNPTTSPTNFNVTCDGTALGYNLVNVLDEFTIYPSLNITENLNVTVATASQPVAVSGRINLSNGTNVSNNIIHIYINGTEIGENTFVEINDTQFDLGTYNQTIEDGQNITLEKVWSQIGGDGLNNGWTGQETVRSLVSHNGSLFAGLGDGSSDADVWEYNGSGWTQRGGDSLNSGWTTGYDRVEALESFNGSLYAGLGYSTAGEAEVWEYNGSKWRKVGGDGINQSWADSTYESVKTLQAHNSKLYAGLSFSTGDGEIWEYNTTNWTQIGGDNLRSSWSVGRIIAMTTYNGSLIATPQATGGEVWRYNTTNWTQIGGDNIGGGWNNEYDWIEGLTNHSGKLYAGTGFGVGEVDIWEYNGSDWSQIGGDGLRGSWLTNGLNERVKKLESFNGKLYAALGGEGTPRSLFEVWEYDNSKWRLIGGHNRSTSWVGTYSDAHTLEEYQNKLYAGLGSNNGDDEVWVYNQTYTLAGNFTSQAYDANETLTFDSIAWKNVTPIDTNLTLYTRTSADNITFSDWSQHGASPSAISENSSNRYIQYLAAFNTSNTSLTPKLLNVTINYTGFFTDSFGNYNVTFNAPATNGTHSIKVNSTWDSIITGESTLSLDVLRPATFSKFNGRTTDFDALSDINNVQNSALEILGRGIIFLLNDINASGVDFDAHVNISNNFVRVNTSAMNPSINTSANITLFNVSVDNPVVYVDPEEDGSYTICADCSLISNLQNGDIHNITFNVTHFSSHKIINASNLTTIPPYPRKDENVTFLVNVSPDGINSINFTVIDPLGVKVIDNANGSYNGGNFWNVTYNISSFGTWLWNASIFYDNGFITNSSTQEIILMEITASLNDTAVLSNTQDPVYVFGKINLSNGTNVSSNSISLHLNGTNINFNVTNPVRKNVTDDSDTDFNKGVFNGTFAVGTGAGANVTINQTMEIGRTWADSNDAGLPSINTSGLVLLMHFNNETGENDSLVKDYSVEVNSERAGSIENNGTINTTAHYNFTNRKFGNASMQFNGSGDEVNLGNPTALDITTFSVSAWIKLDYIGSNQVIVASDLNSWAVFVESSGKLRVDEVGVVAGPTSNTTLNSGRWYHTVFTYNSTSDNIKYYIDGVFDTNSSPGFTLTSPSAWAIGGRPIFGGSYFNGSIDEVAIWNRSLSADEIAELYDRGKFRRGKFDSQIFDANAVVNWTYISWQQEFPYQKEIGRATGDGNDAVQEDGFINTSGLVLLMHFNNETGENDSLVKDYSVEVNSEVANNTNATCDLANNECPIYNFTDKRLGNASMLFDGVNDYFNVTQDITISSAVTLVAWVKTTDDTTSSSDAIVERRNSGETVIYGIQAFKNAAVVRHHSGNLQGTTIINDGNWHHIVGIVDSSGSTLYVDGVQDNSNSNTFTEITGTKFAIGSIPISPGFYWNGSIDEVAIWNRSLSADEVLKLYKRGVLDLNISTRTSDDNVIYSEWSPAYENNTLSVISQNTTARYLQYRAVFSSEDFFNYTPLFNNITINYTGLFTNSFGDYNFTFNAPAGIGVYPIKVNTTWDSTIPGENTINLNVVELPTDIIINVSPTTDGFGRNITLTANVTDGAGLDSVIAEVSIPKEGKQNFSMTEQNDGLWKYNFTDYANGTYAFRAYSNSSGLFENSTNKTFEMFVNLTIGVRTTKDNYGANQIVNLTDPPGGEATNIDADNKFIDKIKTLGNSRIISNILEKLRLFSGNYYSLFFILLISILLNVSIVGISIANKGSINIPLLIIINILMIVPVVYAFSGNTGDINIKIANTPYVSAHDVNDSGYNLSFQLTEEAIGRDNSSNINATLGMIHIEPGVSTLPLSSFDGDTTDFANKPNLQSVCDTVFENTSAGKIEYKNCVNVEGIDVNNNIFIRQNYVEVRPRNLHSTFNTSANITLTNLGYLGYPKILKDNGECADCNVLSWDSDTGIVVFNTTSFSILNVTEANQSKIQNNGTTNASVFLLVKVQFYNASNNNWVDTTTMVNDSEPRNLPANGTLVKLDSLFNERWNTSVNATYGTGTYRVFAAATDENDIVIQNVNGNNVTSFFNFSLDLGAPTVSFVEPSPTNNSVTVGNVRVINVSVTSQGVANTDACTLQVHNGTKEVSEGTIPEQNLSMEIIGSNCNVTLNTLDGYNYTLIAYANDTSGAESNTGNLSFRENTVPEIPTLIAPLNNSVQKASQVVLNYTSQDNDTDAIEFIVYFDTNENPVTQVYRGTSKTFVVDTSATATYYWKVQADDTFENSSNSSVFQFRKNTKPPVPFVIAPNLTGIKVRGGQTFNISWDNSTSDADGDNISIKLLYSTDSGITFPNEIAANLIHSGSYLWTVPSIDTDKARVRAIANDSTEFASDDSDNDFIIDSTPPIITLDNPPNGSSFNNGTFINLTITDALSGVSNVSWNNGSLNAANRTDFNGTFDINTSGWAIGEVNITVYANDSVGNSISAYYRFTIDDLRPVVEYNAPGANEEIGGTFHVNVTGTEFIDDAPFVNFTYQDATENFSMTQAGDDYFFDFDTTSVAEGLRKLSVYGNDTQGRVIAADRNAIIDNTNPAIRLDSPENNSFKNGTPTFLFTPTDANTIASCSLIINSTINHTSSAILKSLTNNFSNVGIGSGLYSWTVNCTDNAGNAGTNLSGRIINIDLIRPVITLVDPPNESSIKINRTINFTVTDDGGAGVDKPTWSSNFVLDVEDLIGTYAINTSEFPEGKTNVTIRANDTAGNIDKLLLTFTFDITPPIADFNRPGANEIVRSVFRVNVTATDLLSNVSGLLFAFNGSDNFTMNRTAPTITSDYFFDWNTSNATDKQYVMKLFGNDTADNLKFESRFAIVDNTPPEIRINGPANNTKSTTSSNSFTFTPFEFNSISSCTLYINGTVNATTTSIDKNVSNTITSTLGDGVFRWTLGCNDTAVDTFGIHNIGNNDTNFTINVDATLPTVNTSINNTSPFINQIINISANATDANGLSFGQIIVNDTGIERIFNFSLEDAAEAEFSQNITISCGNCLVNVTARSNDTFNNFRTNDTLIEVGNTDPATPAIVFPTADLYTSLQPLDLNVTVSDADNDALNISYYINSILNQTSLANTTLNASDSHYILNVSVSDGIAITANATVNFTIDAINPAIRLDSPANNSFNASATFTASFTPVDTNLANCTLYHNFTGTWQANETLNSASGQKSEFTGFDVTDSLFVWDVTCSDLALNSAFNASNFTITIDTIAPAAFNLTSPANGTASTNLNPEFLWNKTVDANFDNYTLEISNETGFETINYTATSTIINETNATLTLETDKTWYWRVIAYDKAEQNFTSGFFVYTTQSPAAPSGDTGTGGGGGGGAAAAGGGGGGGIFSRGTDYSISPGNVKAKIALGRSTEKTLRITNNGDLGITLSLAIEGIRDLLFLSDTLFSLDTGESVDVTLNFIGKETGSFVGKIIAAADDIEKEIPVILEVISEQVLFDAKLDIPSAYTVVEPGGTLRGQVTLLNVGAPEKVDVFVTYLIKDLNGNVVYEETETFAVEGQSSFAKSLRIPDNLKQGSYVAIMEVRYANSFAVSSQLFRVEDKAAVIEQIFTNNLTITMLLLAVLAIFIIIMSFNLIPDKRTTGKNRKTRGVKRKKII